MRKLELLAESMLKDASCYEEAAQRREMYEQKKAAEAGLSLTEYRKAERSKKTQVMVQECIFSPSDDIVIFADCLKAFPPLAQNIQLRRQKARDGYGHSHDFFEISYVVRGYCYHYVNGQEKIFHEGGIFIMNYQMAHERILPDEASLLLTICVRKKVFNNNLLRLLRDIPMFWKFYAASVENPGQPAAYIHLQDAPNDDLEMILCQMLRAGLLRDSTSQTVMKCCLIPLLVEMARIHCVTGFHSALSHVHAPQQTTIDFILETIQANSGNVTLQALAEASHFSPNYLSKLIRDHTGKTFQELSSYYWLEKAKTLLQCTSLGIDKIAELMGASSRGNFERRFKSLVTASPAQYRQQEQAPYSMHQSK